MQREAGFKRSHEYKSRHSNKSQHASSLKILRKKRVKFQNRFYKQQKYTKSTCNINIKDQFGIEHNFDEFIQVAALFVDSHSNWVRFDIAKCSRVWPSAITLLCSFRQWTEITANPRFKPVLSSSDSEHHGVNSYLSHCGFYDYVKRQHEHAEDNDHDDNMTVKIRRENNKAEIVDREESICGILDRYSALSSEQIEDFDCNVLIEAFNNVTEHGNSYRDNGWWTITQYHQRTGIISLCLADNGIGIKNSLLTGPQKSQIIKLINTDADGEYIRLALNENVSGALTGSVKKRDIILKAYERGSRRGNGLRRIMETCKRCGIGFSLLSQKGYLGIDSDGIIFKNGTAGSRIFSGTLYHFTIPAIQVTSEVSHEIN